MSRKMIMAIMLVKKEDLFIKTVLENILGFCDQIHVTDNCFTNKTPQIITFMLSRLDQREDISYYKKDFYQRGPILEKDIRVFGLEGKYRNHSGAFDAYTN
jgi:hypothetical protein